MRTFFDPSEREELTRTLLPIAERRAEADQENPGGVHGMPALELVALEEDGDRRTVHFVFDTMIWHAAQSGSDWFDHNVYVARVVLGATGVIEESIERRRSINVTEHGEPTYDRAEARRAVMVASPSPRLSR